MSQSNEFKKIAAALGTLGFGGAGIASLFTAGIAPLIGGSVALVLAGASAAKLSALDQVGMLEDQRDELLADKAKLLAAENDLRSELQAMTADRNQYKLKLEAEIADFKIRCQKFQDDLEYWQSTPELLEAPPVKKLMDTIKSKLADTTQKLESALSKVDQLIAENNFLQAKIAELEKENDELDTDLAAHIIELNQLKTNFDYRLRDELHKQMRPIIGDALATGLEKKMKEIENLRKAIGIQNESLMQQQAILDNIEKSTLPDIEQTYNSEMSARDSKLMELAGQNQLLQQTITSLQAPRQFPGLTYADSAGNRIINHFAAYGVIFDAHDASAIPGGFCLRFRVDRNQDKTKLSGEEFDKLTNQCGLMGISTRIPIQFVFDAQNFLISVEVFSGVASPGLHADSTRSSQNSSLSTKNGLLTTKLDGGKSSKTQAGKGLEQPQPYVEVPDSHRQKFIDLGCFPADQFSEVVRSKFVSRVRVCAGSTGGKSPLMEMIAVELAKANNGVIWLLNPIPGSEKDWFKVPGIIQPGDDANEKIVEVFEAFHAEFQSRRNNLPSVKGKDYLLLAVDEDNATAREYEQIGTFIKDMYQLSDHVNLGFVSAGQGNNVSGLSGAAPKKGKDDEENPKKRTGNATRLMKEDFQNAVRVYTSEQAFSYLQATPLKNRGEMLEKLAQLNALCDQLNEEDGLKVRPDIGEAKKVSPNAARIALCISPACEPFFFQIPVYSGFNLVGVRFPAEAKVTSPHWQNLNESIAEQPVSWPLSCPHCGSTSFHSVKPYANGNLRYECGGRGCRKKFGTPHGG